MLLLAQKPDIGPLLMWIGAICVVALLGGMVLMAVRRRVLDQASSPTQEQGRLLDDLREALKRGEITQGEFDSAKATMAARMAGKPPPARPAPPVGGVRTPDGGFVARPGVDLTGAPLPQKSGRPPNAGL